MESSQLEAAFHLPEVDDYELLYVLKGHFGSSWRTAQRELHFPADQNFALSIRFDGPLISSISAGPTLTDETVTQISGTIKRDVVDCPKTRIGADVLLCSEPITGRYTNGIIQISPPHDAAPRPPVLGAQHPFVLEFPVRPSSDGFITNRRWLQQRIQWIWVLNSLLRAVFYYYGPRYKHFWALTNHRDRPTKDDLAWCQEFYLVDGFKTFRDRLSAPAAPDLPRVTSDLYYSDKNVSDDLSIPDNFSDLLAAIHGLSPQLRTRFNRAINLLYVANQHWQNHISSYYVTVIQAIESLLPQKTNRKSCPECKRDISVGSTRRFRNFVEHYVPDSIVDSSVKAILYKMRSDVIHGHSLFQMDIAPWAHELTPSSLSEMDAYNAAHLVAKNVVRKWLFDPNPPIDHAA